MLERESRRYAYLRPNLLYTRKFVIVHFLLLLLPRRSDGPARAETTAVNVLLFLLRWLQNLREGVSQGQQGVNCGLLTWNEHSKLSSTLIIAPALSNSPQ